MALRSQDIPKLKTQSNSRTTSSFPSFQDRSSSTTSRMSSTSFNNDADPAPAKSTLASAARNAVSTGRAEKSKPDGGRERMLASRAETREHRVLAEALEFEARCGKRRDEPRDHGEFALAEKMQPVCALDGSDMLVRCG